jgi:hypothetical protein
MSFFTCWATNWLWTIWKLSVKLTLKLLVILKLATLMVTSLSLCYDVI